MNKGYLLKSLCQGNSSEFTFILEGYKGVRKEGTFYRPTRRNAEMVFGKHSIKLGFWKWGRLSHWPFLVGCKGQVSSVGIFQKRKTKWRSVGALSSNCHAIPYRRQLCGRQFLRCDCASQYLTLGQSERSHFHGPGTVLSPLC